MVRVFYSGFFWLCGKGFVILHSCPLATEKEQLIYSTEKNLNILADVGVFSLILFIMGCDVHMFAEIKKDGKWNYSGKVFKNPNYSPEKETRIDEDGYEWNAEFTDEPYNGRNYDLFAILADVRNGRGFAGIKTGEGFNIIAEPKGIPVDISEEVKKESDGWDGDGHSHSFLTVKELLDFDWSQKTIHQGVLTWEHWKDIKEKGTTPDFWCGMASGQNVVVFQEHEANDYLKNGIPASLNGKDLNVMYHWEESYSGSVSNFLEKTIPELQKLGANDDVRIVFWFDN